MRGLSVRLYGGVPWPLTVLVGGQGAPGALPMMSALLLAQRIGALARREPGLLVLTLVFAALLVLSTPRIYATDEVQYYVYLRSLYFDGDLDFRNEYEHFAAIGQRNNDPNIYHALLRPHPTDPPVNPRTGLLRNVAPIGAALLWSPGFVLADLSVRGLNLFGADIAADGYARPYIWAVCAMSALYSLLGLLLTYRLARRLVGSFAATLATGTVWLATPLVFYTYIAMPLAYTAGCMLFALFLTIWLWGWEGSLARRLAQRTLPTWLLLGLVGGLMASTREQLGLMLLLPAVEGLFAYGHLARRASGPGAQAASARGYLANLLTGHCLFLCALVLALLPQLLTYQILNGRPFPAGTVSDKFESAGGFSPHFFATLIDPQHGAFFWSPVLVLGLVGLCWLARRDWLLGVLLGLGFIVQTYLNGAFGSTWHVSGAFGFRRLIECTPIFALGLALLVQWLQPRVGRGGLLAGAAFLVYWNAGLIAQWAIVRPDLRSGLIWEDMFYYQFIETPRQVAGRLGDLLFNRCELVENQNC